MERQVIDAIRNRRSIREFTDQPVERDLLQQIITAGIWAPSGLNNQPWRFVIICDHKINSKLASLTHYVHIVHAAPALIAVYWIRRKCMIPSRIIRLQVHVFRTCCLLPP